MPRQPDGFTYTQRGGEVHIRHHDRPAGTLRGRAAERFLADVVTQDPQAVMARVTGNYKHGNERIAQRHPRNAGR